MIVTDYWGVMLLCGILKEQSKTMAVRRGLVLIHCLFERCRYIRFKEASYVVCCVALRWFAASCLYAGETIYCNGVCGQNLAP